MKIQNVSQDHQYAITRGWVGPKGAASTGLIQVGDTGSGSGPVSDLEFSGFTVIDAGDGVTIVYTTWKIPVRCATTVAGTLASSFENGDVIDGVTLVTGDRILIKDQATASENGIYTVNVTGNPTRSVDMDTDLEIVGTIVYCEEGTTNATQIFFCTNTGSPTIEISDINFATFTTSIAGTFLTSGSGERAKVQTIVASGAAQTLDLSAYNVFDITLTANCTLTLSNPPTAGTEGEWGLILRQGGSGSYTVTYPASVKWRSSTGTNTGSAPTLYTAVGAEDVVVLVTVDGTSYGGTLLPHDATVTGFAVPAIVLGTAAAAGSATTAIRSDSTIIAFDSTVAESIAYAATTGSAGPALAAYRKHIHNTPLTTKGDLLVTSGAALNRLPVGTDAQLLQADSTATNGVSWVDAPTNTGSVDHAHVADERHLSDGSTTTYTLDEFFLSGSVEAMNITTLAWLGVTETAPDSATVSAAGSAGDTIQFTYAAVSA